MSSAYQIIETPSTYSFWLGMLSNPNATIHVDISFHRVVPDEPRLVYHNPSEKEFYGTYEVENNDITYAVRGTGFIEDYARLRTARKEQH
mmetsp:Transcript_13115/g.21466  ORF Transcript_13115/g.21466 Transcript_13115/m.21466 type:complete len:90 (-) Transcript_13115:118-387(-)